MEEGLTDAGLTDAGPTEEGIDMGTFVKVSETYDLSTKVGKMGLVGIHTPTSDLVLRHYSGLMANHKKFRYVKCDVALACASMLPADPLQVGVEAGDIAPQDMFNPILYKAVSNDSMSNLELFIESKAALSTVPPGIEKNSLTEWNDPNFSNGPNPSDSVDQFNMYYGLLSQSGWKKAMPQAGLVMSGLRPIVYHTLSPYGQNGWLNTSQNSDTPPNAPDSNFVSTSANPLPNAWIRGRSAPMPAINTTCFVTGTGSGDDVGDSYFPGIVKQAAVVRRLPPCYVGVIILPPAKLSQLYYRLRVTWTFEFITPRSQLDTTSWTQLADAGGAAYATDYDTQSSRMSVVTGTVDALDTEVEKVMES